MKDHPAQAAPSSVHSMPSFKRKSAGKAPSVIATAAQSTVSRIANDGADSACAHLRHFTEQHVDREPDSKVQHHADDRSGDAGSARAAPAVLSLADDRCLVRKWPFRPAPLPGNYPPLRVSATRVSCGTCRGLVQTFRSRPELQRTVCAIHGDGLMSLHGASVFVAVAVGTAILAAEPARAQQQSLGAPWDSAGRILRASGMLTGNYHRYNMPRRDLSVRVGDVTVAPALALGSWAGFSGTAADATLMGDLVVTAGELRAVLAEFAEQRITVSAIHNHLAGEEPQISYIHFHDQGDVLDMATRLARVVARTATPLPVTSAVPHPLVIDTALVFRALGASGRAQGNVAQVSFNLVPGVVTQRGRSVTPALGYGTPINIQMVNANRAVATGDFSVVGRHVDPVLDALAAHGITATAVHSHLIDEQPTIYYIHFWADGPLADVLRGLRAALDAAR